MTIFRWVRRTVITRKKAPDSGRGNACTALKREENGWTGGGGVSAGVTLLSVSLLSFRPYPTDMPEKRKSLGGNSLPRTSQLRLSLRRPIHPAPRDQRSPTRTSNTHPARKSTPLCVPIFLSRTRPFPHTRTALLSVGGEDGFFSSSPSRSYFVGEVVRRNRRSPAAPPSVAVPTSSAPPR